jgi:hypothetical protein
LFPRRCKLFWRRRALFCLVRERNVKSVLKDSRAGIADLAAA